MDHAEQRFQIQANDLMKLAYPQVIVISIPNGGYLMSDRAVALLKAMGLCPGAPDWLLVWAGGWGFVEFKSPKGRLSDVQRAMHERLRAAGARVAVIRDADDLIATLAAWDVPRRAARAPNAGAHSPVEPLEPQGMAP